MAIYLPPNDAEKETKYASQNEVIEIKKEKTYTQEEVLAMIEQIQEGGK